MEAISIRGEHLTNLYRYAHEPSYRLMFGEKEGYSAEFAMRHDQILQKILESPDQPVKVVVGCDDVCLKTSCPRYNEEKCCAAPELLAKDRRIAESFGVEIGATYPAQELMQRLNEMPEGKAPH